jgi:hypothetical protein
MKFTYQNFGGRRTNNFIATLPFLKNCHRHPASKSFKNFGNFFDYSNASPFDIFELLAARAVASARTEEKMETKVWRNDFETWLDGFPWLWFCSLTFRPGLKPAQARWRLHKWLEELRKSLGTEDFGYFAVRELGKTGADEHFHLLIKGLKRSYYDERLEFMHRWSKLAGDGRIDPYKPGIGGIAYILKNVDPNRPDDILIGLDSDDQMQTELEKK